MLNAGEASAKHKTKEPSNKLFDNGSALQYTTRKQPHRPRNSFIVRYCVEVDVLERLRNRPTRLRIVDLSRDDVHVQLAFQVVVDSYIRWQVESAIERASAVPGPHRCFRAELPYIVRADRRAVQAFLDAVALVLDFRVGEVNFGYDAGDIEAASVADATMVLGVELRTDGSLATMHAVMVITSVDRRRNGGESKDGQESASEDKHLGLF